MTDEKLPRLRRVNEERKGIRHLSCTAGAVICH
jgi:hypothetical protein